MTKSPERWTPPAQSGDKFCTQCKASCPSGGGVQLVTADKLHQRWICKRCKDSLAEALQKTLHA